MNQSYCSGFLLCLLACCSACRKETPAIDLPHATGEFVSSNDSTTHHQWTAALEPRDWRFPRDHGPHENFRIEWWYYTGNLETETGRRFGYQLTFFRTGLQRDPVNPSRWTVRDLYTAHFAISDVANQRFLRFERTHRGSLDWAGARQGRIWNGNWSLQFDADSAEHQLHALQDDHAIELTLRPEKPLILHGENGLSRKGSSPGNASYYYSFTRLETVGHVTIDGERLKVLGRSWMDHEFSSSFLEKGQQGWDWFSIQLNTGEELMIYQMRLKDGSADEHSSGTWVAKDGTVITLAREDFILEPLRVWRSPTTSATYPIAWRVRVPSLELDLNVSALMPNQEMDTSASTGVIYWEGCVDITGSRAGRGYLEMTGYTGRGLGDLMN